MSAIQLYLLEFDNNRSEATRIAQKTSACEACVLPLSDVVADKSLALQSKDVKLVQLIESLGEYLTHEDPKVRDRSKTSRLSLNRAVLTSSAMSYLSEVLAATPSKVLSLQQRNSVFLFEYMCITHSNPH